MEYKIITKIPYLGNLTYAFLLKQCTNPTFIHKPILMSKLAIVGKPVPDTHKHYPQSKKKLYEI